MVFFLSIFVKISSLTVTKLVLVLCRFWLILFMTNIPLPSLLLLPSLLYLFPPLLSSNYSGSPWKPPCMSSSPAWALTLLLLPGRLSLHGVVQPHFAKALKPGIGPPPYQHDAWVLGSLTLCHAFFLCIFSLGCSDILLPSTAALILP